MVLLQFHQELQIRTKKPYIFEAAVKGGDIKKQFAYLKELTWKRSKN